MIKSTKIISRILFIFILFYTNAQSAKEILVYADSIIYDQDENLVATGNAKVISNNEIIVSDIIIYSKKKDKIILPKNFSFKDSKNNYYYGSSGFFSKDLNISEIIDVKILLNDGSRIVGSKSNRYKEIDIINKASYSPCSSKIKIKSFLCPIWQIEGEKILHDSDKLFLYQKHAKMKILNVPILYLPYLVSPSPLRKKRKSGFLSPSLALNFLDAKVVQNVSLPYYFNLAMDKELTLTPKFNYGGGVDSSQRFIFDYDQLISGGELKLDYSMDTTLENQNNEKWFKNASLITEYNQNLNETYKININSALETSRSYIQSTDPNNQLSYAHSLSTSINLYGYNIFKIDDSLHTHITTYQATQGKENNKTTPKILPYVSFNLGKNKIFNKEYNSNIEYYNILREANTAEHAEEQQKYSFNILTDKELIKYSSKIKINSSTYNQLYNTKNKRIGSTNKDFSYSRIFPILGISTETPIKHIKSDILITPKFSFIGSSGQSNSNKVSNEGSTNNTYAINNQTNLNRYNGSDKLDNSKRLVYSLNAKKNKISLDISQNYEFTNNSNYHIEQGNKDHLSDALGAIYYTGNKNNLSYTTRYDTESKKFPEHSFSYGNNNILGEANISYYNKKKVTNDILDQNTETINYSFVSKKILKYHNLNFKGIYNFHNSKSNEYDIGYQYFDECFGINIDFSRKDYRNDLIKPSDTLNITFSFKSLGAYKSSNMAVSEKSKQEIEWLSIKNDNEKFNKYSN